MNRRDTGKVCGDPQTEVWESCIDDTLITINTRLSLSLNTGELARLAREFPTTNYFSALATTMAAVAALAEALA